MPRAARFALLTSALMLAAGVSFGADRAAAPSSAPTPAVPAARRALLDEMDSRSRQTQQQVAELQKLHDATTAAAARQAVQLHIEAAKREGALDLIRIQLRHAEAADRAADVSELRAHIAAMTRTPAAVLPPLPAAPPAAIAKPVTAPAPAKKDGGR